MDGRVAAMELRNDLASVIASQDEIWARKVSGVSLCVGVCMRVSGWNDDNGANMCVCLGAEGAQ